MEQTQLDDDFASRLAATHRGRKSHALKTAIDELNTRVQANDEYVETATSTMRNVNDVLVPMVNNHLAATDFWSDNGFMVDDPFSFTIEEMQTIIAELDALPDAPGAATASSSSEGASTSGASSSSQN